MEQTEEQFLAWSQAKYEHHRRIAAIRFAKRKNHTWSSDHPDSIRNKIKQLNALLFEAEASE